MTAWDGYHDYNNNEYRVDWRMRYWPHGDDAAGPFLPARSLYAPDPDDPDLQFKASHARGIRVAYVAQKVEAHAERKRDRARRHAMSITPGVVLATPRRKHREVHL